MSTIISKEFKESTAPMTTTAVSPDATKKRTRTRRRPATRGVRKPTSCGNVSESSEESGKRSLERRNAPKKTKTPQEEQQMSEEEQEQYLAMDCEMVGVGAHGTKSMLARVTIVNWNGEMVYDQFIRPTEPVTDYRTFVSGITAADLEESENDDADSTTTTTTVVSLETCRARVLELVRGKTVVGHALKNDLAALQIQHPWQYTRDTAKYEPFMKQRFDDGVLWPRKLKELMFEHLQTDIQLPGQPHSAYEDAVSALKLYKCVRSKWEKVMQYKIRKTADIELQQRRRAASPAAVVAAVDLWPALVPAVMV